MSKSVIKEEVEKFSKNALEWWKKDGKYKVLHKFNSTRVSFIKNIISKNNPNFSNLSVLDVGCGGGILSESLVKLNFNVTGIDASLDTINIAIQHAQDNSLNIKYLHITAEDLLEKNNQKYDIICAMEIIEHVNNPQEFVNTLLKMLKPDGYIFFSTINRNLKSLFLAKITAEYILNWIPKNTHDFNKFITPNELINMLKQKNTIEIIDTKGVNFSPLKNEWILDSKPSVNYLLCAKLINYN
jgi:2-polyprenyl-6-hydroxyphenyl methylase/3-demethylubiquinone-9 3-methyltransferase